MHPLKPQKLLQICSGKILYENIYKQTIVTINIHADADAVLLGAYIRYA